MLAGKSDISLKQILKVQVGVNRGLRTWKFRLEADSGKKFSGEGFRPLRCFAGQVIGQ